MASNEASGNNSEDQCPTVAPSGSSIYDVPDDLLQTVFQHLSATDLCHVASCSRWLRDATNQDSLWRTLCQSRGWEHYGTTTDLAKITSYGPRLKVGFREAGHYSTSATFQNDRIVTDDNKIGLTSTCRWKSVYMRANHLDRNWVKDQFEFKVIPLLKPSGYQHYEASVDGDLLVIAETARHIHVYDIRKGIFLDFITVENCNHIKMLKIKDGNIVLVCRDHVVRAFDVKTRQEINSMEGCRHEDNNLSLLFDGELVITFNKSDMNNNINVWDIQDGKQRILTDATMSHDHVHDWDYRDKMVVAANNSNILVWDARSGECLHKLPCGKWPRVKLRNNVIVCLSQDGDTGMRLLNIWSLDTGECQQVISLLDIDSRSFPLFINSLIVVEDGIRRYDVDDPDAGREERVKVIYDLNGKLVKEKMDRKLRRSMLSVCDYAGRSHGSKCPFVTMDPKDRCRKPFIFNVTPNGLVQLFAAHHTASSLFFIWMDEIRMIVLDRNTYRLRIFHYW